MYYGTRAANVAEWIAIKAGKIPLPILDIVLAPVQARTLAAAVRLGVLQRLAEGEASVDELARALSLDTECLGLLLRVLQSMGYTELRSARWTLSSVGRRYFGPKAREPYESFVEYGPPQFEMLAKLEQVLKTGEGIDFHDHQSPEDWDAYQRAMFENARAFAWFVVDNLSVRSGARRCIDLAGAHGWIGAALCRKHEGLRSTVIDRAEALPRARAIARERGYDDVVEFTEGDVRTASFGSVADVALLCNILHHFTAAQNRAILERVRGSMQSGGTVGIFEIETPREDARPDAAGDGFALYFRVTSGSQCFRGDDYLAWLREAGFVDARAIRSIKMPSRVLVVARAP